jgi:soluble lytic murein transglycosylase-like protein
MTIDAEANAAAKKYDLDVALICAQVKLESNGDPLSVGDGGRALGVLQIHLEACKDLGRGDDWHALHGLILAEEAEEAAGLGMDLGCAYLLRMLTMFHGDVAWALAAYNQGPTVIRHAKQYSDAVLLIMKHDPAA